MLRELLAGPLASKAPAHLMTDPYAVVPAQRSPRQPPAAPPPRKPSGQIGGRAMIGPGESLTDRLAALRGGNAADTQAAAPSDATAAHPTSPYAAGAPPAPPVSANAHAATGEMPAAPWEAPGPGFVKQVGVDVKRAAAGLLAKARSWPRPAQLGVAGGVVALLVLTGLALLGGGGGDAGATPQAGRGSTPSAVPATFATQVEEGRGLSVKVPDGWARKASGVWVDFIDPADSNRKVRILVEKSSAEPGKFLAAAANRLDQNTSGTCSKPYRQVSLQDVTVGGEAGSQLEYTCGSGPSMRHGVWRAVMHGGKAYSFFLTTPDSRFADSRPIFDEMARTFVVAGA
jgi:hypothetical protein